MKRGRLLAALFFALPVSAGAAPPADPGAAAIREKVRAYRVAHEAAILAELRQLLALPNLASDKPNIEKNADAIAAALQRRGVKTELWRIPDAPPVVYGELNAPGAARTAILYAHYDGQPVVASQWTGEPWKPVLRDKALEDGGREIPWEPLPPKFDPEWRVYARSASDDKAPIIALLSALDAMRAQWRCRSRST
jgi:acetylornithine deacetylase/succinyl-diaminopimelate desuccinylase-like protein